MIHPIRYYGDPALRQAARAVTTFDAELVELADDMIATMYASNGVGLAAPQIGVPLRLFVAVETREQDHATEAEGVGVDEPQHAGEEFGDRERRDPSHEPTADEKREAWGVVADHAIVNPEIVSFAGEQFGQEGCLSIPGLYVENMRRAKRIRIRYQDVHGEHHERAAEGYFARILQHETDHLDGILFFDRLPDAERTAFLDTHRRDLAEMQREAKALLRHLKRTNASVAGA